MSREAPEGAIDAKSAGTKESQVARERDALVMEIAADMSAGKWGPGSIDALAKREGVAPKTVTHWSAAAARMLRLANTDAMKALHALNVKRLNDVYDDASVDGDHKARVSAIAEQNKLCGLIVQKVDLSATTVSAEEWAAFRALVMGVVCDGCRAQLVERLELEASK